MKRYNPYENIFFYFKSRSHEKGNILDYQIEDNTTKALINTLSLSQPRVLGGFLEQFNIDAPDNISTSFELQSVKEESRPDAVIWLGQYEILIESKVHIPLEAEQLKRHLRAIKKGKLLAITNNVTDSFIIASLNDNRVIFTTWRDVYYIFKYLLPSVKDSQSLFLIKQFLEYLEIISMAPFTGWSKKDFEAFLFGELDPKLQLRTRVKEKLLIFISELYKELSSQNLLSGHDFKVGHLKNYFAGTWGVISIPPLEKIINTAHINFELNADSFSFGIQIEGKLPTRQFLHKITSQKRTAEILFGELNGFKLIISKREELGIQRWLHESVAELELGENIAPHDIDFIINKSYHYPFFVYRIAKFYRRDDSLLDKEGFLNESVSQVKRLIKIYEFARTK